MTEEIFRISREFSEIAGLQTAYTLVYSLVQEGDGCRMSLNRTGENARADCVHLPITSEWGKRLICYLCENAVQPELWRDVLMECTLLRNTAL